MSSLRDDARGVYRLICLRCSLAWPRGASRCPACGCIATFKEYDRWYSDEQDPILTAGSRLEEWRQYLMANLTAPADLDLTRCEWCGYDWGQPGLICERCGQLGPYARRECKVTITGAARSLSDDELPF